MAQHSLEVQQGVWLPFLLGPHSLAHPSGVFRGGKTEAGKGEGRDMTPKVDPEKGALPHPWKQGLEQGNRELGCRSQFRPGLEFTV